MSTSVDTASWIDLGKFRHLCKKTADYGLRGFVITDYELERRLDLVQLDSYPLVVQAYLREVIGLPDANLYHLRVSPEFAYGWLAVMEHDSFDKARTLHRRKLWFVENGIASEEE